MVQKAPEQAKKQTPNLTGIPTQMKLDFERRSGLSFDDVRVHYNSEKPRKIGALAYTQIPQVHIGPGQERHLQHELGHVVQQKRGIVRPNLYFKGFSINDSLDLEREADCISGGASPCEIRTISNYSNTIQRKQDYDLINNRAIILGVLQSLEPGYRDIETNPLVIDHIFDDLLFFDAFDIADVCLHWLHDRSLQPVDQVILCDNDWRDVLRWQGITDPKDIARIENATAACVTESSLLRQYRDIIDYYGPYQTVRPYDHYICLEVSKKYKEVFSYLVTHLQGLSGGGAYDFRIQAIIYNSHSPHLQQYPDMEHDLVVGMAVNPGQTRQNIELANMLQHEIGHRRQNTILMREFSEAPADDGVRILAEYENVLLHENGPNCSWRFRTYYTPLEVQSQTSSVARPVGFTSYYFSHHSYIDSIIKECNRRLNSVIIGRAREVSRIRQFLTNLNDELAGKVSSGIHRKIREYLENLA